ncbi:glycosyl hydrolase family 47 protein [Actinidia rufa]|uniref:alpha-1,2-Mannosidase n=1 Tax=Actinidia rufa TaxID=165716 RepID=A0A7J0DDI2_9ERIC|nr:glycosyl hydrolase family 47 protein [Actinidia rufa]
MFRFPRNFGTWVLIFLVISPTIFCKSMSELDPRWAAKKRRMSEKVRNMSLLEQLILSLCSSHLWRSLSGNLGNRFTSSHSPPDDVPSLDNAVHYVGWSHILVHLLIWTTKPSQLNLGLGSLQGTRLGHMLPGGPEGQVEYRSSFLFRFYHAYDNYMTYAFPHDELKPLTKTYTDSLVELGNLKLERLPQEYNGSALTLVESLSSLVIMGNSTEFERAVLWLSENLTFDIDARINLFECNIRVLGGLVSAHILATDSTNRLVQGNYKNQLLSLADDLGRRFLPAFDTPTGLPYAWINLKDLLKFQHALVDY